MSRVEREPAAVPTEAVPNRIPTDRAQSPSLSIADASRFARMALVNIEREYPAKLDHVIVGVESLASPRTLHPAFFGSFDWHSCVHAHWLMARVLKIFPELPEATAMRRLLDTRLTPDHIRAEVAYLARPESAAFERTYGWAWLLKLADELASWDDPDARAWTRVLSPLTDAFVQRYLAYLPKATYAIRHGMHSNSAFGLAFALDYARAHHVAALADMCLAKAREWYLNDRDAEAQCEPSGTDFLSPSLIEADLMRRVLDPAAFSTWLRQFLPGIERHAPSSLFTPAFVSDRSDGHIAHLDGLNLSRAWCWRAIGGTVPPGDVRSGIALEAASSHLSAGLEGVASGHYAGDHWLATFAVLALTT